MDLRVTIHEPSEAFFSSSLLGLVVSQSPLVEKAGIPVNGLGSNTSPPAVEVTVKGAMSDTDTHNPTIPHCSLLHKSNLIIRNLLAVESGYIYTTAFKGQRGSPSTQEF